MVLYPERAALREWRCEFSTRHRNKVGLCGHISDRVQLRVAGDDGAEQAHFSVRFTP